MSISQHRRIGYAAMAAITAIGLAVVALTGVASASSSRGADHHGDGQVLKIRTVLTSKAINHAGNGGPGDVAAMEFAVQRLGGTAAGTAEVSCTTITADVQLCHAGFVLAAGQIEAQASIPMTATKFTAAVVGGTGKYQGVAGQIRNVVTAPGVIVRTFHLIYPDQD
jgi:hypothetical protein